MKIVILSPFYPYRGGIASFSNRLYQELNKAEDIEIEAFSFSLLYPSFLFPGKTQYIEDDGGADALIRSERTLNSINPLSWIATAKAINRCKPDVLIVAYWMPFVAPALGTVVRLIDKKIKVLTLVHNALPHEKSFWDKGMAKYFFRKCTGFIVLSKSVQNDLETLVAKPNILEIHHPIYDQYNDRIDKVTACNQLGVDASKKTLLFFGLIRDYKGLDLLIEAMAFLSDDFQLIIAGECYGDFRKYQDLINKSPFKENIRVLEQYIPDDMVTTLFSATDVLVLPYRDATQSGVVAVAYQMETPVIATRVGALAQMVESAFKGVVVDVDPESIAAGIKRFFEDSNHGYIDCVRSEKKRLSWASFVSSLRELL